MTGNLYIVATPIGNLADITGRAIEVLSSADIIAAEDTRTSSVLLDRYGIAAKLVSNHKFNEEGKAGYFIDLLKSGKNIALISDAGTPCISDPGFILVSEAVKEGIGVTGIPGACAAVTAVSISGFEASSFSFYGFLPREKKDIVSILNRCMECVSPVSVFYESPNRIKSTMKIIGETVPSCNICLCNDLTKKFERIYRGTPAAVLYELENNSSADKGEYTLVIERTVSPGKKDSGEHHISAEAELLDIIIKENCTLRDAAAIYLGRHPDARRNDVYSASLKLKKTAGAIAGNEDV